MVQQDFEMFRKMMRAAADMTVMPNGKDTDRVIIALFEGLKQYSLDEICKAVSDHCRNERFFPMLADITSRIEGGAGDRSAAAWALVLKAVSRYGHSESVRFPSPAIHYAIEQMGGWCSFCAALTYDNMPFRAKDFAVHFSTGERVASWDHEQGKTCVRAYLPGEHEVRNRGLGHRVPVYEVESGKPIQAAALPESGLNKQATALVREVMSHAKI